MSDVFMFAVPVVIALDLNVPSNEAFSQSDRFRSNVLLDIDH